MTGLAIWKIRTTRIPLAYTTVFSDMSLPFDYQTDGDRPNTRCRNSDIVLNTRT